MTIVLGERVAHGLAVPRLGVAMFVFVVMGGLAQGADLPTVFSQAADEYGVPEKLLLALSYEASHWRPDVVSAWSGYGLFDFQEELGGPNIEAASIVSGIDPDEIIRDPVANTRAAAAWLAHQARLSNRGQLPSTDQLLRWWDGVRAFSGSHSPIRQDRFAGYIYELINFGIEIDEESGLRIDAEPVDHWSRVPVTPPGTCDYGGCDQWVSASSSNYSNYSRDPSDIDYVILHTVQGSYDGCISWFQNASANVSAHYVVRSSDGAVTQMVAEEDVAWHAGNWEYNLGSVGIEHEGYVEQPSVYYTETMYQSSADLTRDIADRNSIPLDRDHIIAHSEVPGATHTDPGAGWDWDYYMELIGGSTGGGGGGGGGGTSTGNVIGVVADSDIYNGDRIVGATVWVAETGESIESDSTGYYRFYDLPLDTYTIHACMDGYSEATCTTSLSTGDNWCSMAIYPGDGECSFWDSGGGQGGGDSRGELDTGNTDTGGGAQTPPSLGGEPGEAVGMWETRACAHASGTVVWPFVGLGLGAFIFVRRRPPMA